MKHGFAIIELIFVIAFFALITAVVIMVVDPLERARQNRDGRLEADSVSILEALNIYLGSVGKLPWATGGEATPALVWTRATSPQIGICANDTCSEGGKLIQAGSLGEGFLSRDWLTRDSRGRVSIAKGRNAQDKVYACFVPESQETRRSIGKLYQLEEGKGLPPSGLPTTCSDNVSWQDEDVCYICVAK